jgi:hypothetical protein
LRILAAGRLVTLWFAHEHARRRVARDRAAGLKIFDDRDASLQSI